MKKLFLTVLTVSIFLLLGSIGFGCGDSSSPVSPGSTESITDINDRGGCILLEISFYNNSKSVYWVATYFEENGFLVLYNNYGFLISIDINQISNITETNYCNNK